MGRDDDKKIPEEGTTAPDGRPQLRAASSVFDSEPASTLLDEDAEKRAALQAAADHVLGASTSEERARSIDLGPSGTDATLLNLEASLDDTRPSPMVSKSLLEESLAAQGVDKDRPVETFDATVAGVLAPEDSVPRAQVLDRSPPDERALPPEPSLPSGIAPRRIPDDASVTAPARPRSRAHELGESTDPGELAKANTGVNQLLRDFAETEEGDAPEGMSSAVVPREITGEVERSARPGPRLAATLTFVPEAERARAWEQKPRGVPKHESLLDRIGEPAPIDKASSRGEPKRFGFLRGSPVNIAAFVLSILAVLILIAVVFVSTNRETPKIESRPLPSGPTVGD